MEPLIGAISAGNAVLLKPSELAPASSNFLANNVSKYLDKKAIKVIGGGPDVGEQLLEHKWDKIFFTGKFKPSKLHARCLTYLMILSFGILEATAA